MRKHLYSGQRVAVYGVGLDNCSQKSGNAVTARRIGKIVQGGLNFVAVLFDGDTDRRRDSVVFSTRQCVRLVSRRTKRG